MAEIQIRANEAERAGIALHEALVSAVQTGVRVNMLYGVLVATKLWQRCGAATRAAEWAGLLLRLPGVDYAVRRELRSVCAELTRQLGEQRFAAAMERGKALDLDAVAAHIVSALT